jgi:Protein of unknown function (DUF2281)
MSATPQMLIEKLEQLPPQQLAEVEDFVDFLQQRNRDKLLRQDYARASEAAFAKAWDNDEDAIYDQL